MKCPVCKQPLDYHTLAETDLPAYQCTHCEGIWISANEYYRWLRTHGHALPTNDDQDSHIPMLDSPQAKLCPGCGHFLMRYRVLPGVEFFLERCGSCNGVWFDKGEWQVLVERNLHDKINQFFTQSWQTHLREEDTHAMLDKLYLDKFGPEDYARIKEIWSWLIRHPRRSMLLAYLQSNDPYKA